jgi:hypothetical protein
MNQQINLYQPILREEHKVFGASTAVRAGAAILVTLLCIWGYGAYKVQRLQTTAETLREQRDRQDQTLVEAGEIGVARASPTEITARVKEADAEVAARTRALELLRTGAAGRTTGFAERLEALARRHLDGVWIDRMALSGATDSMSLDGATVDPDLVPRYLQSLAQESVLSGARFDQLVIERPVGKDKGAVKDEKNAPSHIRFHAQSLGAPVVKQEEPT